MIMGKLCVQHCIDLYKMGNDSMADCLDAVTDMLATCEAMNTLAASNSSLAKDMAKVCVKACESCEKECKKHAKKHESCKNCAEACADCIKACKALAA
jgi:Cys-rich four helix bundle protein (predicted Tat secretion target)